MGHWSTRFCVYDDEIAFPGRNFKPISTLNSHSFQPFVHPHPSSNLLKLSPQIFIMQVLAAFAALLASANAHYIFEYFQTSTAYQYVRQNTNYNSPVTDLTSTDLRCNVGGSTGGSTGTYSVAAGSSVTFKLDTPVYHQGPISFYMSKAPSTAASYDGSGDWVSLFWA
jgi:hypothetical protein